MNMILSYINESLEELRQVRWPTQQQAVRLSTIVIGFIIVTSLFFGFVDTLLSEFIRLTIKI
jgi:preprotein translocase SecE subunit